MYCVTRTSYTVNVALPKAEYPAPEGTAIIIVLVPVGATILKFEVDVDGFNIIPVSAVIIPDVGVGINDDDVP